jgi:hypothetical protein
MLFMVPALLIAQTPTTFNYQAVLRNTDGTVKKSVNVNIGLEIHQATETGTVVYSETHSTTTSEFGMVNLEIGSVTPATFATIDWALGPYFVEVSVDGLTMGTSELLTVPYALYAVNGVPGPQGDQGIQGEVGSEGPPGTLELNSVSTEHVIDNSLTAIDLAANSVGSSELGANAVGSGSIIDGSILNADISTSAAIASSKIFGDAGIEWDGNVDWTTWADGEIDTRTIASFTMDIPTSGYVLLNCSGYARIYEEDRVMRVGVGTSATAMTRIIQMGFYTGIRTESMFWPYSVSHVVGVTAGTWTFYVNGESSTTYDSGQAMIRNTIFTGIFIPKRY